jgi:hypothetical protein
MNSAQKNDFQSTFEEREMFKIGGIYLHLWGSWASQGCETGRLGYGKSTLAAIKCCAVPVETVGEAVDRVLCCLPVRYRNVAVLLYQRRHSLSSVCRLCGCSGRALDETVRYIKTAVYVGIEKNN